MNRRSFMQSILAAGAAPYVVTTAGVLMPTREIYLPIGPEWFAEAEHFHALAHDLVKLCREDLQRAMAEHINQLMVYGHVETLVEYRRYR